MLGKNGSGKSTLLHLVCGLLRPQQGLLEVNGYIPQERHPDFLADIYLVPEEFALPSSTIEAYTRAYMPLYPAFDHDKLEMLLTEFELKPSDRLHKLSHGQRKKFLIALALSSNCKLLVLDEPTNGLDIPSKSLFRKMLVKSVSDEQLVLISTHQVKDIDTILDDVLVLDAGQPIFHSSIGHITGQYKFELVSELDQNISKYCYTEKCPFGYRVIRPTDPDEEESTIDLELFFNAVITHSLTQTHNENEQPLL